MNLLNPQASTFSQRLKDCRKKLKLTQTEFGKLGGVGITTQCLYEKGETEPTVSYFENLAKHKIDTAYLVTGTDRAPAQPVTKADLHAVNEEFFKWLNSYDVDFSVSQRCNILNHLYQLADQNPNECRQIAKDALSIITETLNGKTL